MVRDRTEGKVKITPYYGAALASPDETFEFTLNGVADIAEGITYATPGRFPLTVSSIIGPLLTNVWPARNAPRQLSNEKSSPR